MGRKNLALVGTHRDYFADMLDERVGMDPSMVSACASPEDAASSYFRSVFENSGGLICAAVVAVWPAAGDHTLRQVFDVLATVTPCGLSDDPGAYDVAIEARTRP